MIDGISDGATAIKIELPGPVCVQGTIVGPLETLPKTEDGQAYIHYCELSEFPGSSDRLMEKKAIIRVQDGKGYFELTDLWGTHVSIGSDYYTRQIALADEKQTIAIDLVRPENRQDSPLVTRQVIFMFVSSHTSSQSNEADFVSPSGSLEIHYVKPHPSGERRGYNQYVDIENGQAVCDVVTVDSITCAPHDIKGMGMSDLYRCGGEEDAQGRFRFGNLPPGEFSLGCRGAQLIGETGIVAGQRQPAIVRVKQHE